MHRNRTWNLTDPELRTVRNRGLATVGGDSSILSLDFSSGVLDPRMVSTRTSPATFVNQLGYIEWAGMNLITHSENFVDSSWTKSDGTDVITAQAALNPTGTLEATKIVISTTSGVHGVYKNLSSLMPSTRYTQSCYAKANGLNWMYMTEGNTLTSTAYFNLATGQVGTVTGTGSPSATITAVGNGWYRCTLSFTTTNAQTTANIQIRPVTADNTFTNYAGNGTTDGILIWGAQVNIGASAQKYYQTTTLAYHAPRFDWDPENPGTFRGLLCEKAKFNYVHDTDFTTSAWNFSANPVTGSYNTILAPTGLTEPVRKLTPPDTTTNGRKLVSNSILPSNTLVNNTSYTYSIYVKRTANNTTSRFKFGIANGPNAIVDLINGTLVLANACTAEISKVYNNDWYKVSLTYTYSSNAIYIVPSVYAELVDPTTNTGPWIAPNTTDGFYVWGPQFEEGKIATSYIPNGYKATASVSFTRTSDYYYINPISSFWKSNITECTLYYEGYSDYAKAPSWSLSLVNTTGTGSKPGFYFGAAGTIASIATQIYSASNTLSSSTNGDTPNNDPITRQYKTKAAFAFKANSFSVAVNKRLTVNNNTGALPTISGLNQLSFGATDTNVYDAVWLKVVKIWPTKLTNNQLQAITDPNSTNTTAPVVTVYPVELLLIGGGGGGGRAQGGITHSGGGGGGGGVVYIPQYSLLGGQEYLFTVGDGGAGGRPATVADPGSPTEFFLSDFTLVLSAAGGGRGGQGATTNISSSSGGSGASGGGAGAHLNAVAGSATTNEGCSGGGPGTSHSASTPPNAYYGAGGGGAGGAGANGNEGGGAGGAGFEFGGVYYAGGGGGGAKNITGAVAPLGGSGSGGNGGLGSNGNTATLFGGGGGGAGQASTGTSNYTGGTGASGGVIIRYPAESPLPFSYDGDWETQYENGYVYHIISTSGTLLT